MSDLNEVVRGLLRARNLVRDLDRVDAPHDRRQVADGVRHELDAALLWLQGEQERLRAAAAGDRPGKVRRDAPATSWRAGAAIEVKSGTKRHAVLQLLLRSPQGATDWELQQGLNMAPSTERPRRGELVDAGLVALTGRTREHQGSLWNVWEITDAGRAALGAPVASVTSGHVQPGLF